MLLRKVKEKSNDIFLSIEQHTKELANSINKKISYLSQESFELELKIKNSMLHSMNIMITENDTLFSAGFIHLYSLPENQCHLWQALWLSRPKNKDRKGHSRVNKITHSRLDPQTFKWLTRAETADRGYLHGPYVDYSVGTNYIFTQIHPVYFRKKLIGVAATTITVRQVEDEIDKILAESTLTVVITTLGKRILFSNHPRYRVSELAIIKTYLRHEVTDYIHLWVLTDDSGASSHSHALM